MYKTKKRLACTLVLLLLFAVFALSACSITQNGGATFSVGLNLNGGEGIEVTDFISGNTLVEPTKVPTKKGCQFLGWYYDSDFTTAVVFNKQITKNIVLFAKWSDIRWEVVFVYGGEIDSEKVFVEDKGKVSIPEVLPTRNGYTISGWYKNTNYSTPFSFSEAIQDDVSIYAKWDIVSYAINYNFDDGIPHINTVYNYTINSAVTLFAPTRSGYDFLGWYEKSSFEGEPVTNIAKGSYGEKELFARYLCYKNDIEKTGLGAIITENTIVINVNDVTDSLTLSSENITVSDRATFVIYNALNNEIYQDNIIPLPDAPAENYLEISDIIIKVTSEKGTTKEYALTIRKYAEGASVTVIFDTDKAAAIGHSVIGIFTKITPPTLEDVDGYIFEGWCEDMERTVLFDFDSLIGSDITLYAKFTAIIYNISYSVGVGENAAANTNTYTVEDTVVFSPAKDTELYEFVGWYRDKNYLSSIEGLDNQTGDISIFAKYTLKEDNSAMVLEYSGSQIFGGDGSTLTKYLEYAVYNKLSSVNFNLDTDILEEESDNFLQNAWRAMEMPKNSLAWTASRAGKQITINFVYNNYPTAPAGDSDRYTQLSYLLHEEYTKVRGQDFDDFKINSVANKVVVSSSEMLFYALSVGYRPLPVVDSSAERIYNKAKAVLRNIVDDSMSDIEKLHSIYDWIITSVVYDKDLLSYIGDNSSNVHGYNGFYLEGVFDDYRAVCDGISKAFVVLARMEGIECYQVTYSPEIGVGHAWNVVKVNGNYYVIDATSGGTIIGTVEALSHKYFMISDSKFKALSAKDATDTQPAFDGFEASSHIDKVCQSDDYEIYAGIVVLYGTEEFDMVIESQTELNALLVIVKEMSENVQNDGVSFTIDAKIDFNYGEDFMQAMSLATQQANLMCSFSFDKGYLIIIVES